MILGFYAIGASALAVILSGPAQTVAMLAVIAVIVPAMVHEVTHQRRRR